MQGVSFITLSSVLKEWKAVMDPSDFEQSREREDEDGPSFDEAVVSSLRTIRTNVENLEVVLNGIHRGIIHEDVCVTNHIGPSDSLRSIARKLEHLGVPALPEAMEPPACPLRVDDLLACFLDDLHESMVAAVDVLVRMPRPRRLPGVATLSEASCALGNSYLNSNSRMM